MSASYGLVGERMLRKYTEASVSPVYAAESEVKFISSHLCEVPWESANGVRNARMTWHTSENVGTEEQPVSGLDRNVAIRDEFDAALFCAGHSGGGHRAYANAACYRYELPAAAVGKTLESLKAVATGDPYNAVGLRIALLTNSTGEIPTDCGLCRNGGRLVNGAYVQDESFHTEDGVAKRRAENPGTANETWYPVTEDVVLNPSGFVLQKYLFVFVLLENYNFSRGNWIEGSGFIENRISVTLNQAVSGWTEGSVVDLSGSPAASTFPVSGEGSGAIRAGGSSVVMFESSVSGWKFPERKVVPLGAGSGHSFTQFASDFTWRRYSAGPVPGMAFVNAAVGSFNVRMSGGRAVGRRLYLSYSPGSDGIPGGFLPGIALNYSKFSTDTATEDLPIEQNADVEAASVQTNTASGASLPAFTMLSDGSATSVRMFPGGPQFTSSSKTFMASPVVVTGPLGTYVLGFLTMVRVTSNPYNPEGSEADQFVFLFADSDLGTVNFASEGSGTPFDAGLGTILASSFTVTPDFSAYVATAGAGAEQFLRSRISVTYLAQSDGGVSIVDPDGETVCTGESVSVYIGGVQGGGGAYVVRGRLSSVGGKPCSRYAFVSDGSVTTDREIETSHVIAGGQVFGAALAVVSSPSRAVMAVLTGSFTSVDGVEYGGACAVDLDSNVVSPVSLPNLPSSEYVTQVVAPLGLGESASKLVWTYTPPELIEAFEPSAYDEHLLDDSDSAAVLGLRNCYGDLADGMVRDRRVFDVVSGVSFVVRKGVRTVNISYDGGASMDPVDFPVWRILASSLMIPTSLPTGFRAGRIVVSWGSDVSVPSTARVNVWVLPGRRVDFLDQETEADHRLYDASERTVGGWILAGTCVPKAGSADSFAVPDAVSAGSVATILFTAYVPGDSLTPDRSYPVGIGSLEADSDGVISGVGGGLAPDVHFEP